MKNKAKVFYENNKTIEIVEHSQNLISMSVTFYSNDGEVTYARIYDNISITFDDVINLYKKLGVDWIRLKSGGN